MYRRCAFFSSMTAYCILLQYAICNMQLLCLSVECQLVSIVFWQQNSNPVGSVLRAQSLAVYLLIVFLYFLSIVLNKTHQQHLAVLHSFSGDQWQKRGGGLSPLHLCLLPFTEEQQPGKPSPLFKPCFWSLFPTRRGPPFSSWHWYTYVKLGVDLAQKWRMRRLQRRKRQIYSWNCLSGALVTQKSILVLVVPDN